MAVCVKNGGLDGGFDLEWRLVAGKDCGNSAGDFLIKQNQIITMVESQNVEYKESWRDEYLKWICGFANAQGGRIYIGIRDDGSVNGVPDAARLLEDIPNKIRNSMGILADVNLLNREGKKRRRNYCSACRLPGKLPRRISAIVAAAPSKNSEDRC